MKNFEQRKNEIFQRSQRRIQKRKRTMRIVVSLCIPLVLCIGVCSIWFVPRTENAPEGFEELTQENGEFAQETYAAAEDVTCGCIGYAVVSVDGEQYSLEYSAYHDIDELITNIRASDHNDKLVPETDDAQDECITHSSLDSCSKKITITVTGADGTSDVYSLSYMCLTDMISGEAYVLNQGEYQQLLHLLTLNEEQ